MRHPRLRCLLLSGVLLTMPQSIVAQGLSFPALSSDARVGAGRAVSCEAADRIGNARCGVFRVWENRERSAGRTIDIAFVVLEASDRTARRDDAVILLPGGPGQTFTDRANFFARDLQDLRRTRDILLVDVRGVGRSQPLDCDIPYPDGFRSRFGTVFPPSHTAACRDTLRRRADLAQYTTASTVDDLDELRAWLRYPRLNLLGGSYGTRVAQMYLRRHPKSVRSAVLNGVAPIAEPLYVQHARLLQRALDRVVAGCAGEDVCAKAHPQLAANLTQVLERFRRGPVDVEVNGQRVTYALGDLSYALRGLLYNNAHDVPALITAAAAGRIQPLAEYYVARTDWIADRGGSAGYHFSVLCAEDIAPLTDADVARATADTFMGAHLIDSYRTVCNLWPYARLPRSHWTPVRSDVPTLLLSGGRDPVTPAEGGAAVAQHLANAVHVVVPAGGHGVGGPCVRRMIQQVIETASVKDIDISCIPR